MDNYLISINKNILLYANKLSPLVSAGLVYSRKGYLNTNSIKKLVVDKYKNRIEIFSYIIFTHSPNLNLRKRKQCRRISKLKSPLSDRMYYFILPNCTTWQSSTHIVSPEAPAVHFIYFFFDAFKKFPSCVVYVVTSKEIFKSFSSC